MYELDEDCPLPRQMHFRVYCVFPFLIPVTPNLTKTTVIVVTG